MVSLISTGDILAITFVTVAWCATCREDFATDLPCILLNIVRILLISWILVHIGPVLLLCTVYVRHSEIPRISLLSLTWINSDFAIVIRVIISTLHFLASKRLLALFFELFLAEPVFPPLDFIGVAHCICIWLALADHLSVPIHHDHHHYR